MKTDGPDPAEEALSEVLEDVARWEQSTRLFASALKAFNASRRWHELGYRSFAQYAARAGYGSSEYSALPWPRAHLAKLAREASDAAQVLVEELSAAEHARHISFLAEAAMRDEITLSASVLDFRDRNHWMGVGYATFAEFVEARLPVSVKTVDGWASVAEAFRPAAATMEDLVTIGLPTLKGVAPTILRGHSVTAEFVLENADSFAYVNVSRFGGAPRVKGSILDLIEAA